MSVKDRKLGEIPDLLLKDIDNLPKMLREDIPFGDIRRSIHEPVLFR
jgi:hypothetical protein